MNNNKYASFYYSTGMPSKMNEGDICLDETNNKIYIKSDKGIHSYSGENTSNHNTIIGEGTSINTSGKNQFVLGTYNNPNENSLFTVGNGTSSSKSNALEVLKNGKLYMPGSDITKVESDFLITYDHNVEITLDFCPTYVIYSPYVFDIGTSAWVQRDIKQYKVSPGSNRVTLSGEKGELNKYEYIILGCDNVRTNTIKIYINGKDASKEINFSETGRNNVIEGVVQHCEMYESQSYEGNCEIKKINGMVNSKTIYAEKRTPNPGLLNTTIGKFWFKCYDSLDSSISVADYSVDYIAYPNLELSNFRLNIPGCIIDANGVRKDIVKIDITYNHEL